MQKPNSYPAFGIILGLLFFLAIPVSLSAQEAAQDYFHQVIEIITENLNGSEEFDYSDLGQFFDDWTKHPIDINSEDAKVFVQWKIITEIAYQQLQDHIRKNGPLLSVLELQSIPGFDPAIIRILQVISTVKGREIFTQTSTLGNLFVHGQNEIYMRVGRTLEKSDGYLGDPPAYEGNPDKLYFRFRHRNSSVLSYGITGEKDSGEAFFKGSNKSGFDFYSAHLALEHYRSWLPALIIGDFSASFGQGLIMHSGFGVGKSSLVTSIKRSGDALRPYTSVDENNFLRGVGISLKPSDKLTLTLFGSHNKRDGNLLVDTLYEFGEVIDVQTDITSLQESNLHRTQAEIADENAINLTQEGLGISYQNKGTHFGFNALHSHLSAPLNRTPDLYNQFYFNGDKLTNASVDYGFWLSGLHFFGETAVSDNGGLATVNGLLAGLDRHILGAVLFRSYDRDYQSLSPNTFGESSLANNEIGLYTGLEITPTGRWKLQLYHDIWKHPWLRYQIDSPTAGEEYFSRITYTIKRRLELYGEYQTKTTSMNLTQEGASIPDVFDQHRSRFRLNVNNMIDKTIQLRTRLEWSFYSFHENKQHGFLVYQDFVYQPISSPWSVNARVTLFDTDSYDSRIYTYENDLTYYYLIPSFSDRGSRYYINLRYKGIRHLTMEIKYARTRILDMTSIGSGHDEIPGNTKTEIRGQVIYRFEN